MSINFNDLANCPIVKDYQKAFSRMSTFVVEIEPDDKVRTDTGIKYKSVDFVFADGQKVTLSIKETGDIFRVAVNGAIAPIKNQDAPAEAVGEIVHLLDAGRAKYQAKLLRTKVMVPGSIRTASPKIEEKLKSQLSELDNQIAGREQEAAGLRGALGRINVLDSATLDDATWSEKVKPKWRPPEGFFTKSAEDIASGLKAASDGEAQAMERLDFYINRGGDEIKGEDKSRLESAKTKLKELYGEKTLDAANPQIPGPATEVMPAQTPAPGSNASPTPDGQGKDGAAPDPIVKPPAPARPGTEASDAEDLKAMNQNEPPPPVGKPAEKEKQLDDTTTLVEMPEEATGELPGPTTDVKPALDDVAPPGGGSGAVPAAGEPPKEDGGEIADDDEKLEEGDVVEGSQETMGQEEN